MENGGVENSGAEIGGQEKDKNKKKKKKLALTTPVGRGSGKMISTMPLSGTMVILGDKKEKEKEKERLRMRMIRLFVCLLLPLNVQPVLVDVIRDHPHVADGEILSMKNNLLGHGGSHRLHLREAEKKRRKKT